LGKKEKKELRSDPRNSVLGFSHYNIKSVEEDK